MKKIITLCFFAFAMIIGTQTAVSQSLIEINSLAAKKTQALKKVLKFNAETEELIYTTYQAYEQKKSNMEKIVEDGRSVSSQDQKKIDAMLTDKFKSILTDEQFKRYLSFADEQK